MKGGFIQRVLTVNFDPILIRACALLGFHPASYDFAASQILKPEHVPPGAIFYLHGLYPGFVLLNTEEEVKEVMDSIKVVVKKLDLTNKKFDLVFVGSLFKCEKYFKNILIKKLKENFPKINFLPLIKKPVEGAVKLALMNM